MLYGAIRGLFGVCVGCVGCVQLCMAVYLLYIEVTNIPYRPITPLMQYNTSKQPIYDSCPHVTAWCECLHDRGGLPSEAPHC